MGTVAGGGGEEKDEWVEGRGGWELGVCCWDKWGAGRGNLGGGQETESVAVERGHSTAAAFSGRFSLCCRGGRRDVR